MATDWERRNEAYLAEIASADDLDDHAYLDVLDDLISRAEGMAEAKREEIRKEEESDG